MLHDLTIMKYNLLLTLFYLDATLTFCHNKAQRGVFLACHKYLINYYKDFFSVNVLYGAVHVQCLCTDKHTHRLLQAGYRKNLRVLRVCLGVWRLHRGAHKLLCMYFENYYNLNAFRQLKIYNTQSLVFKIILLREFN